MYDIDLLEQATDEDLAPVAKLIIKQLALRGRPFAVLIKVDHDDLEEVILQLEDIQ